MGDVRKTVLPLATGRKVEASHRPRRVQTQEQEQVMPEYRITVNDKTYSVNVGRIEDDTVEVKLGERSYTVGIETPGKYEKKFKNVNARGFSPLAPNLVSC